MIYRLVIHSTPLLFATAKKFKTSYTRNWT